jgi:hypothetical protein
MKLEIQPLFNQIENIPEIVRLLITHANDPNIDFKSIAIRINQPSWLNFTSRNGYNLG